MDLRTGRVVRDRGVLRGITGRWEFGRFAEEPETSTRSSSRAQKNAAEDERPQQPRKVMNNNNEDSDDELDSFAYLRQPVEQPEPLEESEKEDEESDPGVQDAQEDDEDISLYIAPSTRVNALNPDDPKDAADLQEFLEAERIRREIYGSEEEDIETDGQSNIGGQSVLFIFCYH